MPYPFQTTGQFTGSISSGSYFNESDHGLFYSKPTRDFWFGFSPFDATEVAVYDFQNNQISWNIVNNDVDYKRLTFSYENEKNQIVDYSYDQLISEYVLYKNDKVLNDITDHLSKLGIGNGEYRIVYNYVRFVAGRPDNLLSIKDISPSRKEIKLIPTSEDSIRFRAFSQRKFQIKDISSLLLQITNYCPYDDIFRSIKNQYQQEISFIQSIFFLPNEGDVLRFLRNIYEDYVKYVSISTADIDAGKSPDRIKRIQGIRTYFQNWLRSNNEEISDFGLIENKFTEFTDLRIAEQFKPYQNQKGQDYANSKKFINDFFVLYFYKSATELLQENYNNKYFSYLKNALDFGENRYALILNHTNIIENDQIVLLVKLAEELPSDIKMRDRCWVSNLGNIPFVFNISVQGSVSNKTFRISPPDFTTRSDFINVKNINKLYTADDLRQDTSIQDDNIVIQKKITELNVDYGDFENFVVFSSAKNRLDLFKGKVIQWTTLSSSLSALESYSSVSYPYKAEEIDDVESQMSDIIDSFDGFESYLFNGQNFTYNLSSEEWNSSSYVSGLEDLASEYDRNNSDSLINNSPEYIVLDENNNEYLTFLTLIGHYFDNLALYIKSMPVERTVKNQISGSMSINMLKDMLGSFGWNVNDIFSDRSMENAYLPMSFGGKNDLSDSDRMQTIWNRILITLPQLYKTKGTEECVRLMLACHGIPTDLISVKEYGGVDYSSTSGVSHIQNEKVFLMHFTPSYATWIIPFPHITRTLEFKFSFDDHSVYSVNSDIPIVGYLPAPFVGGPGQWRIGVRRGRGKFDGQVYFRLHQTGSYSNISGSSTPYLEITSSTLPVFNGDVFSVMLRRNYPPESFTTASVTSSVYFGDIIPNKYDLYVQKNESGRVVFRSTSSIVAPVEYNKGFSDTSKLLGNRIFVGNWSSSFVLPGNRFYGTVDRIRLWRVPIDDGDFEDHVNDFNSYSWNSASAVNLLQKNLYFLSDVSYPIDVAEPIYITGSSSGSFGSFRFPATNEYFSAPGTWTASGSLYTGSTTNSSSAQIAWIPYNDNHFRSGSYVLFLNGIWQNVSHSLSSGSSCVYATHSVYPYQYKEVNVNQAYSVGKYGPNRFKNNKIKKTEFVLNARLDDLYTSTTPSETLVSPDSNIFGFFSDPQDFRNKDTVHYIGYSGILDEISDPGLLYSSSYSGLKNIGNQFVSSVNKRTLFTELMTLNKFYFDKSIFDTVKNVAPARANTLTGILIEPSIIERPKYQHKPITSDAGTGYVGVVSDIESPSGNALWVDTQMDMSTASVPKAYPNSYYEYLVSKNNNADLGEPIWYVDLKNRGEIVYYNGFEYLLDDYVRLRWKETSPPNHFTLIDLKQINNPNTDYPVNYGGNYINDLSDIYQLGWYADAEKSPRNDSVIPNGQNTSGATRFPSEKCCPSGSAIYYLVKRWRKYHIHTKSGSYHHDENPRNDNYTTASVYLYDLIHVSEEFYKKIVYLTDSDSREFVDPIPTKNYEPGLGYHHSSNTFVSSSNQILSNIKAFPIPGQGATDLKYYTDFSDPEYFEIFGGYPRNHYIHKMQWGSPQRISIYSPTETGSIFIRGRQTIDTTIGIGNLEDGTLPVTSIDVSNINVVANDNVLN